MRRITRFRPTPATVVATIALLVALAGTGTAAVALVPRNSVGSEQVINGSLRSKDFRDGVLPGPASALTRSIAGPVVLQFSKSASPSASSASVASLAVDDPGTYLIWAKARFAASETELACDLIAGTQSDTSAATLPRPLGPLAAATATLSHLVVQRFTAPGTVDLKCSVGTGTGEVVARDITIVAMRIATPSGS